MSGSNGCFLTCIQISQDAGKVVWCFHHFKNVPQFVVIHSQKLWRSQWSRCFCVILLLFLWFNGCWQLISGSSAFSKSSLNIWKFSVHVLLSLAWRILSITLLTSEMSAILWYFEHSLALPFFGIGVKTELFASYGHCWVFKKCWLIECSTLTASSFRIWNSSTGILSPPLALFLMKLPKGPLDFTFQDVWF